MRIAIDACCWSNLRGFGRFTRELVSHMVAEHPGHEYTLVVDRATAEASRLPAGTRVEIVDTREAPTRAASAAGARSPADLWRMARAAARVPADLFFFPAVYSYFPMLRRIPTVVTFHDAIAESHPRLIFPGARARLFWTAKTWLALRQASRILTVSLGYPASDKNVPTQRSITLSSVSKAGSSGTLFAASFSRFWPNPTV